MRKILILLLTVVMIAATFIGCTLKTGFGSSSADTNENGLRDDVELKILKAYYKRILIDSLKTTERFNSDDFNTKYYGTYNDAVVINIQHKKTRGLDKYHEKTIAGFIFEYANTADVIIIWKNNEFYGMQRAYELGILNDQNIAEIHKLYR